MPELEDQTRRDIAAFLPEAIETALESYRTFSMEQATSIDEADCKKFKEHHDACKVAIAHIKLLIDLAKWADIPDPKIESDMERERLSGLVKRAQEELYKKALD